MIKGLGLLMTRAMTALGETGATPNRLLSNREPFSPSADSWNHPSDPINHPWNQTAETDQPKLPSHNPIETL